MRVIFFVSRRVRKKYVETLMSRNKSKDDVFFDPHRYLIVGTHKRYGAWWMFLPSISTLMLR